MSYQSNNSNPEQRPGQGQGGPGRPGVPPSRGLRSMMLTVLILGLAFLAVLSLTSKDDDKVITSRAELEKQLEERPEAFKEAYIQDQKVYAVLRKESVKEGEPSRFEIVIVKDSEDEWDRLLSQKLGDRYVAKEDSTNIWAYILPFLPWVLLIGLFYFFFIRQMRQGGGPGGVLNFGRTRAKLFRRENSKTTFEDVAGMIEAKEEVCEIIEFLRNPKKFQKLGARMPRGLLFIGPPGIGKTLLAKAIAGEADVPFYSISGSDFVEMFVGVGASRVRDLFRQAKENSPCIIFLDEIDAVGRRRGMGFTGAHDEREQTLNAILVEMDGFETSDQVVVIAATNRPDVLDEAIRRPGRFDREVAISLPDIKEREAILRVHSRAVTMAPAVDLKLIARGTPGFSGADLAALINEAALAATMTEKDAVELTDLEEARDKVRWGRAKRSRVMDEMDKRVLAYHEAGHALLTVLLQPDVEPLHKVTIVPRGAAMGATMFLPQKDRYVIRRRECLGNIMVSFGGRISEELVFEDISSGASDDIKQATGLARRMVKEWGMSSAVGPVRYTDRTNQEQAIGIEMPGVHDYSEETAREIDAEVRRVIDGCYGKASQLLVSNRDKLERLAEALLAFEVLDADEVQQIIEGRELQRPTAEAEASEAQAAGQEGEAPVRDSRDNESSAGAAAEPLPEPSP
ncbi:MAG: ATP-dependent zinc metalloprotease FtsH [Anaerolineaceae bacterium]|nr:ATP-dependent zinc metalloprotease FtsH [Anaerolineaceae bacterium]